MYVGGKVFHVLKIKNELFKRFNADSKLWIEFDMEILRSFVFREILQVDAKDQKKLDYVKDFKKQTYDCINKIRSGEYQIAFFLNPVDIDTIEKVKEMGKTLPPKTTCFYPKVYSGVVIYKFDGNGRNF